MPNFPNGIISREPIEVVEQASVGTPTAGSGYIYPDTTGRWWSKDDAGIARRVDDLSAVETFSRTDVLTVGVGTARFYFPWSVTILGCRIMVGVAPAGADLIVDVNKNGTTIYSTQANRPTIVAGAFVSTETVPDVTNMLTSDYLTVDRDQIGSTTPGSDLQVVVRYERA